MQTSFIKKWLSYFVTGSFTIVFAACYGPPVRMEEPKSLKTNDDNGNAIPGLKVTLFEDNKELDIKYTNENGFAEFNFIQKNETVYSALVEDIDGADNYGDFKSQKTDFTKGSILEIKMKKKD
jgi:hypothetical protein